MSSADEVLGYSVHVYMEFFFIMTVNAIYSGAGRVFLRYEKEVIVSV